MKLWLYCDGEGRLQGVNPNNMTGNTGWIEAVDASILGEKPMSAPLTDSRGIAKYTAPGGVVTARTQEEMDAEYVPPVHQPSDAERIAALEAQLASYEAAYAEGVNEA